MKAKRRRGQKRDNRGNRDELHQLADMTQQRAQHLQNQIGALAKRVEDTERAVTVAFELKAMRDALKKWIVG